MTVLSIRRFMQGADEPIWVEVLNAAYKEYEAWWRATTVEEMLLEEKRPNFDLEGRFIAEFDGKPVGIVHAHVDKLRKEKKGFINTFCVVPEFRGCGVEEELAEMAINELSKREMNVIEAWTDSERNDRIQLLEKMGFKLVRRWSDMEIALSDIPSNIGENKQVTLRLLQKSVEEDVNMLNWLGNECFKEHFDYRPSTIEETRYSLHNNPKWKDQEYFFAVQNHESAGYIGVGIDEKYNTEKNVKSGFILTIGVLKRYRRTGIGTQLMLQALESLKAKGMAKAILDVDDLNPTKAIKLYAKVGFKVVKKYSIYEKNLLNKL
ncbi:MAG: GNAT family N-acetyltransferase [Candidatus Bathyarchaeota archaeon]|nr:MAG: GNAT family N-acetyltransferase [Candidatus Bathyarchaeota archaeon]